MNVRPKQLKKPFNDTFKITAINPFIYLLIGSLISLCILAIVFITRTNQPVMRICLSVYMIYMFSVIFAIPYKLYSRISFSEIIITQNEYEFTFFSIKSKRYFGITEKTINLNELEEIRSGSYHSRFGIDILIFYHKNGLVTKIYILFSKKYCREYILFIKKLEHTIAKYNSNPKNSKIIGDFNRNFMNIRQYFNVKS